MNADDKRQASDRTLDELDADAFLDTLAKSDPAFAEGSAIYDLVNETSVSLKQMRQQAKLTQAQLAEKLGVSQGWISQIESGLPDHAPNLEMIARFALACGFRATVGFVPESDPSAATLGLQFQFAAGAFPSASAAPSVQEATPVKAKHGYGHSS